MFPHPWNRPAVPKKHEIGGTTRKALTQLNHCEVWGGGGYPTAVWYTKIETYDCSEQFASKEDEKSDPSPLISFCHAASSSGRGGPLYGLS